VSVPGTSSTSPFTLIPRDYGKSAGQYNLTPTAAACSGCHDSTTFTTIAGNTGAKAHMIQVGGAVLDTAVAGMVGSTPQVRVPLVMDNANGGVNLTDTLYATAQSNLGPGFETCPICHGPGGIADLAAVHTGLGYGTAP